MGISRNSERYIKFFLYLSVIVLANAAAVTLFFRIDLTRNGMYSLSSVSRAVVTNLSEPLTIDVFFTRDLPAPYNSIERYLRDLLEEYAVVADRNFNYRFYDVSARQGQMSAQIRENQQMAEAYGIRPIEIQVLEKDEVKFKKAYMGLVIIQGDIIEKIPAITTIDGLEYKLTTAVQKLNNKISRLMSLPEPVKVTLFLSRSLERVAPLMRLKDLKTLPDKLKETVEQVSRKNYGKLAFDYVDASEKSVLKAVVDKYGLLQLNWPDLDGGRIKAGGGAIGLVMAYGDKSLTIPLMQVFEVPLIGTQYSLVDLERLPEVIEEHLATLIDINETLGFVAGHGTLNVSGANISPAAPRQPDDVRNARRLISQTYSIRDIKVAEGIPDSVACLVIARPTEAFSDYELFQIDQHLMRGGSLALLLDAFEEEQNMAAPMMGGGRFAPIDSGLQKLLNHYGIGIESAYVMDEECFRQRLDQQLGGERSLYFAPLIKKRAINRQPAYMMGINTLIVLKASPLRTDEEKLKDGEIEATRLFSSSEKSWLMKPPINLNPMLIHPPGSTAEMKSYPLAYMLEGRFRSYFADRPAPARVVEKKAAGQEKASGDTANEEEEKGKKTAAPPIESRPEVVKKGRPGRIFLVASAEMMRDSLVDEQGRSPNAIFLMNVIDHLNGRDDVAMMRGKVQRFNPLWETAAGTRTFVKVFNIAGLPVLVSLAGLLVWSLRRSRQRRIRRMFTS